VISVNTVGESLPLEVDFSVRPLREAGEYIDRNIGPQTVFYIPYSVV
jgi:hypothetical protein